MTVWFTKNLGDAMLAGDVLEQIQALFLEMYGSSGQLDTTAIFIRHESEGRLHCEVKAYFPPATVVVAKAVHATPCTKPKPGGLGLLIGSDASWSALFPDLNS